MASGVAYLHRKGVIHGNLRPSNVLYKSTRSEPHFKVQLSDYGLERLFSRGVGDDWPVPEILNGSAKNADKASDMFLLGCLFLYVFTGLQPFGLDVAQNVKQGSLAVDPSVSLTSANLFYRIYLRLSAENYKRQFDFC